MDNLQYKVVYDELPEKAIMRFSGQLIINYIENITDIVKGKVNTSKDLDIIVDNPESVDITFIQLLVSVKNTIEKAGKKVNIDANLKDEIQALITNAGFNHVIN